MVSYIQRDLNPINPKTLVAVSSDELNCEDEASSQSKTFILIRYDQKGSDVLDRWRVEGSRLNGKL